MEGVIECKGTQGNLWINGNILDSDHCSFIIHICLSSTKIIFFKWMQFTQYKI